MSMLGQLSGEYGGKKLVVGVNLGSFMEIRAITATSVSASVSNIEGLSAFNLGPAESLPGVFSSVTLTSGDAIGYSRRP